jgi:hypothetical protein
VERGWELHLDPHAHPSLLPLREDIGAVGVMYLPNWLIAFVLFVWMIVVSICILTFGV